ncbi:hypothetical protein HH310_39930 [Actinoplanes sp. TBRC 11911]|uniref:hypothetical protein n=1 Tax=Actinoplanes sp. TBRC 11911 TaxID=2729386 RepID=UPI00145E996F|nr:hypothetical protein [Actinoplanes sp. TBRC 11911]NMO57329.1 hypothetical protein [Actinoplanes sp. TBRC 11911]
MINGEEYQMKYRLRTTAALAVLAVTALAACDPAITEKGLAAPAPTTASAAPTTAAPTSPAPTTPAGPTFEESCAAYTKAFIDGSKGITDDSNKAIEEGWGLSTQNKNMRKRFDTMAKKVSAEAAKATDPKLKAEMTAAAKKIAAGAKSSKPGSFLSGDFQKLATSVDKTCGNN